AAAPLHDFADHAQRLLLQGFLDVLMGQLAHLDEDGAEPALAGELVLELQGLAEIGVRDQPAAEQDRAEALPQARRAGVDDPPVAEQDQAVALMAGQGQLAALLVKGDEMQDLGEAQVVECGGEAHRLISVNGSACCEAKRAASQGVGRGKGAWAEEDAHSDRGDEEGSSSVIVSRAPDSSGKAKRRALVLKYYTKKRLSSWPWISRLNS